MEIVDSDLLNKVEQSLEHRPDQREAIEQQCFQQAIFTPLQKQGAVKPEHARPSGKPMRPREGVILSAEHTNIPFKRTFSGGAGTTVWICPSSGVITASLKSRRARGF